MVLIENEPIISLKFDGYGFVGEFISTDYKIQVWKNNFQNLGWSSLITNDTNHYVCFPCLYVETISEAIEKTTKQLRKHLNEKQNL